MTVTPIHHSSPVPQAGADPSGHPEGDFAAVLDKVSATQDRTVGDSPAAGVLRRDTPPASGASGSEQESTRDAEQTTQPRQEEATADVVGAAASYALNLAATANSPTPTVSQATVPLVTSEQVLAPPGSQVPVPIFTSAAPAPANLVIPASNQASAAPATSQAQGFASQDLAALAHEEVPGPGTSPATADRALSPSQSVPVASTEEVASRPFVRPQVPAALVKVPELSAPQTADAPTSLPTTGSSLDHGAPTSSTASTLPGAPYSTAQSAGAGSAPTPVESGETVTSTPTPGLPSTAAQDGSSAGGSTADRQTYPQGQPVEQAAAVQTSPANPDLGVIPSPSSPLEAALRAETDVPVRDIPDLLAAMSDRGASRLTVSLSPEGLGRVQLSVASSPQGLVVTVMGAQSALEMLSRTEIVMVLAARGMQVTSVDLVVQGNSASSSSPDDQSRPGSSTTDHGDAPGQQRRSRDNESEDPYAFWS